MSKEKTKLNSLMKRSVIEALLLVIVAAATLEATALLQMKFSQDTIKKEALLMAESAMDQTKDKIMEIVTETETSLRNSSRVVQWSLPSPDSVNVFLSAFVADNPTILGASVSLVPGYDKKTPLYAPFAYIDKDGVVSLKSLATPEYDYPSHEWFKKPLELGEGYWSEPYYDTQGSGELVVTYSVPVKDRKGKYAAVFTADVSLDWLYEKLNSETRIFPHSFQNMISRSGTVMMCPVDSLVMNSNAYDIAELFQDKENYLKVTDAMLRGESGMEHVKGLNGKDNYVYYVPIEHTGWSMSTVIPAEDIFADLKKTGGKVTLLQLLGLVMLLLILVNAGFAQAKYQAVAEEQQSMESELRIGRDIQMSMIPKAFPPFPERNDIDMAATIVPAKEVGGDLYDFYIRDEKLFFCIGDVSGKGVPASLVMAVTRSLFRNVSAHESNPARIVSTINDSMADVNENNMFVTFFLGILDMKTGQLDYCNAGHNAPLILSDDVRKLEVDPNAPLAVVSGMNYTAQQARLKYDDAIFLYTDGVTEAENEHHHLFGEKRMEDVLRTRRSAENHLDAMRKAISKYVGEAPQSDDITMLFIHYLPERKNGEVTTERRLVLHNDIQQIPQLAGFMEDVAKEAKIDNGLAMSLNLALEEAVTNVILYAYPPETDGLVDIEAIIREDRLDFIVSDSGKPFDPTAVPDADITLGIEEREIGGLGIHLVKKIMDKVTYERPADKNILTMTKKL